MAKMESDAMKEKIRGDREAKTDHVRREIELIKKAKSRTTSGK